MKILVLTSLYPSNVSPNHGIFIKNRMNAVARRAGHEVAVVAPVPYFPPVKRFKKWYSFSQVCRRESLDEIDVYHPRYLVTPKVGMSLYGLSMFLGALNQVRAIYKEFPFDVIDAHYIFPDAFAAILMGRVFKKPVVVSARGSDIHLYSGLKIIRSLLKFTLNQSHSVITVCSSLKEMIVELGIDANKITVIPNGINGAKFYRKDKVASRSHLGMVRDTKIILSIGSLIELKGHHILLDAFARIVSTKGIDVVLYILGEGEYRGVLERKIKQYGLHDRVFLPGQIPNAQLVDYYNAADLFFLGSSREGWPNVISEALACGTPVVATKANGIPEILKSTEYGLMVDRDVSSFVNGICEALQRQWDCEAIASYGQSRTWDLVAKEAISVLKKTAVM